MLGFYKKDFTFSTMVQKQSIALLTDAGKWLRELVSTNGMKELEVMFDLIGKLGFKAKLVAFRLDQDTKKLKLDRTLGERSICAHLQREGSFFRRQTSCRRGWGGSWHDEFKW